jgi:hypothetical protein
MPDPKDDPKSSEWRPYIFARDQWHSPRRPSTRRKRCPTEPISARSGVLVKRWLDHQGGEHQSGGPRPPILPAGPNRGKGVHQELRSLVEKEARAEKCGGPL